MYKKGFIGIIAILAVVLIPDVFKATDVLYGFSLVFFPGITIVLLMKLFKL